MVARTRGSSAQPLPSVRSPSKRSRAPRVGKAPTRRSLFPTDTADDSLETERACQATTTSCPDPCEPEMDRQDSACSVLTVQQTGGETEGPATPVGCQSSSSRRTSPGGATSLYLYLEAPLVYALQTWRQSLVQLQPLVKLGDEVLLGALALMRELTTARPDLAPSLHTSDPHLFTYLAAALWLVAKLTGVRTQIPNRSLMSQATQVHPQALSDFELDLLFSLDWDVAAVLRQHGLLC